MLATVRLAGVVITLSKVGLGATGAANAQNNNLTNSFTFRLRKPIPASSHAPFVLLPSFFVRQLDLYLKRLGNPKGLAA